MKTLLLLLALSSSAFGQILAPIIAGAAPTGGGTPITTVRTSSGWCSGVAQATCTITQLGAAHLLLVPIGHNVSGANVTGVTDTAGNTFMLAGVASNATNPTTVELWYAWNTAAIGSTDTITVSYTTPPSFAFIGVVEKAGIKISGDPADGTCGVASGTSTAPATGAFTVTSGSLVSGVSWMTGGNIAADAGPPAFTEVLVDATFDQILYEELIASGTSANVKFTGNNSNWPDLGCAFLSQ